MRVFSAFSRSVRSAPPSKPRPRRFTEDSPEILFKNRINYICIKSFLNSSSLIQHFEEHLNERASFPRVVNGTGRVARSEWRQASELCAIVLLLLHHHRSLPLTAPIHSKVTNWHLSLSLLSPLWLSYSISSLYI